MYISIKKQLVHTLKETSRIALLLSGNEKKILYSV